MRCSATIISLVALAAVVAGCGGGVESGTPPREQGMEITYNGSYQVKGSNEGRVQGVGIYSDGSFRIVLEGVPRVVIHSQQSGENWMINLAQKNYEPLTYDEALSRAGFMPHLYMKGRFEMEQYWVGPEFHMDTEDGRSIRGYLGGPHYLPSQWEAKLRETVLEDVTWEYRRVGHISPDNFKLPEGLTLKE